MRSTIFVLMLLMGALFVVSGPDLASAATYGDYEYQPMGSGTEVQITRYTGHDSILEIPSMINGMRVTSIGYQAFLQCVSLTSVSIPDSVLSIEQWAFHFCTSMTTVTIGKGVASIGAGAFANCTSLTTMIVSTGNADFVSIDGVLYDSTNTTLVICPGGRTGAFTIPGIVTSIGSGAFYACTSLTSVMIPSSVTSIGVWAFYACNSLTSVTIPNGVTTIEYRTFYSCVNLTSATIGSGVTTIEDWAFNSCVNLTSIDFLGLSAPTSVDGEWILGTDAGIRGHAYTASDFPAPPEIWNTLTMGAVIPATPSVPRDLSTMAGNAQVILTWTAPADDGGRPITTYKLYRSTTGTVYDLISSPLGPSYTDSGLTNGQTYWYKIGATNSIGDGVRSGPISATPFVTTPPTAPQNLQATPGNSQVALTWQAPVSTGGSPVTSYDLYRASTSGGTYALIASPTGMTYTDTDLVNGQICWYKVSAINSAGEGASSSSVNATPLSAAVDNTMLYAGIAIAVIAVIAISVVMMRRKK